MVDKIDCVERGDLVELVLKVNARKILEAQEIFVLDRSGGTNTPGRRYVGYTVEVTSDSISLAQGWDEINDKIPDRIGGTRFYFNAIEVYSKKE